MKVYSEQHSETYNIDLKTRNTSFLKMALLYQSMGIRNCYFMLRLDDKSLQGVNPYSNKLTDEQRVRIWRECFNNRWYFYREVFRVSEGGTGNGPGGGVPFILNRLSCAVLWACEHNLSTYSIAPRQTGKTWSYLADCAWTFQFCQGANIVHFNKSQADGNMNLSRLKAALGMLPIYLQHSASDNLDPSDKRLIRNREKSMTNVLGSTIEAMASAGNEAKADAMSRGKTAPKMWYDEIAFIFFVSTIYTASTPAYEKAREIAIKNHQPYGISISTTPGDLATPHGAFAYKMMMDCVKFDESFFDMPVKKLYDVVQNTPDKIPYLFIQFTYLQLGETEEWYLQRFKNLNNPLQARREYLLEWMNSNGNSPFDPDDIELIGEISRQRDLEKKSIRINKYFEMSVYEEYHGRKPVVIGVDVAAAIGRDSSAVVVVHPETLHPIAIFRSNMIESSKLRKLLTTIVKKLYPNCVLAIENNSVGGPLISELKETPIGRVLYKQKKTRKVEQQNTNNVTKHRKIDAVEWGYHTDSVTRPQMMEMLESIVHNSPSHLGYSELYEEIRFLELKNGRIDHSSATHDDVTLAYMGALWCIRYGTGLRGKQIYYNISDGQDDYDEMTYDTMESIRFANRLLRGTKDERKDAEDELVEFLRRSQHVETSNDLATREREEYFRMQDRISGLSDEEDDFHIDEDTENLLLKNYQALTQMDPYGSDDPIEHMLHPVGSNTGGFLDQDDGDSWANYYKY